MTQIRQLVHPVANTSLQVLRNQQTPIAQFRRHTHRLSRMLVLEATRALAQRASTVQSPLEPHDGQEIATPIVLVPVLRAGLAMLFAGIDLFPDAQVGFVGLERDELTAKARSYYCKLPADLAAAQVLVLDPMLATGGSMDATVRAVKDAGATRIHAVCMVAAPEGIAHIVQQHGDVTIVTAAVDRQLDENKFIRPGLGDFGDRYFGA